MKKVILTDVHTIYYQIVDANKNIEEKRYRDEKLAQRVATKHKGRVVKITKRMLETLEMEKV
jgi:hypothetical protein